MNFKQFGSLLPDNPLCGISTYKDTLNLATGACTRQIKKLVLTGEEMWKQSSNDGCFYIQRSSGAPTDYLDEQRTTIVCTHFKGVSNRTATTYVDDCGICFYYYSGGSSARELYLRYNDIGDINGLKAFLAAQYAAGTPVIVWYILATPTTETITVPSGLSGTEEGYLIQDGTPTPTNPIYPTDNEVKVWHDIPHYIMGTSTDTITTLPADIYVNDTTATVGLKGNMSQTGTPTPTTPIQPSECGDMSSNMFDITAFVQGIVPNRCTTSYDSTTNTLTINATGNDAHTGNANPYHIPVTGGEIYTLSWITNSQNGIVYIFENGLTDSSHLHSWRSSLNKGTITMQNDTTFIIVRVGCDYANETITYTNIRLNVGSTALPYEPYGVKIPISSANTTTPVYLGEVETTRKIKKLVLTGEENIIIDFYYINRAQIKIETGQSGISIPLMSTHYGYEYGFSDNMAYIGNLRPDLLIINDSAHATKVANFKSFLAQQYTNGTPVTVWYVLAEPTTGIVNEPLRKIGDYADEVSGISIPTIAGANTLLVDTTLQPSEVSVNYHGWHPVQSVHEYDSNYTIATMQALTIAQLQTHTISELQGGEWS